MKKQDLSRYQCIRFTKKNTDANIMRDLHWLLLPARIGDTSWQSTMLKKENELAVSDGYRLHLIRSENIPLPDGTYSVIRKSKSEIILQESNDYTFPDVEKIIPNKSKMSKVKLGTDTIDSNICKVIHSGIRPELLINIKYIQDVLLLRSFQSCYIGKGELDPILFDEDDKMALIMLLRR